MQVRMGKSRIRQMFIRNNPKRDMNTESSARRSSPMVSTGTSAVQIIVTVPLPRVPGHSAATKMYSTLPRDYDWPGMANDLFQTTRNCRTCVFTRGSRERHHKLLKLFPAAGSLEFVAMDFLGPFKKSAQARQYILVVTDRFIKFCRAVPMNSSSAAAVSQAFLENWVYCGSMRAPIPSRRSGS